MEEVSGLTGSPSKASKMGGSPSPAKSKSGSPKKNPVKSPSKSPSTVKLGSSRIPVLLQKKTIGAKSKTMVCQVDDPKLTFVGDSGAVGRLTVDEKNLKVDLKGRQYDGTIQPGPTVMLLNLAPAVGKDKKEGDVARIEMMSDEFVELNFTKDVLSGLMGDYQGAADTDDESAAGSVGSTDSKGKKKRKGVVISQVTNKKRKTGPKKKKK